MAVTRPLRKLTLVIYEPTEADEQWVRDAVTAIENEDDAREITRIVDQTDFDPPTGPGVQVTRSIVVTRIPF